MRDVVVIGGGLSGLAAAYELEKRGIAYTLIEVKRRLGGSILTTRQDNFVVDGGPFVLDATGDWSFLDELGLSDARISLTENTFILKDGAQSLTDALAARITAPRMMRMAVSSVGEIDGRFAICMENGMLFDAKSLIIAAPARFTERMFYGYITDISALLLDYHYDSIVRVSLGYHKSDAPLPLSLPPDMAYAFYYVVEYPRAPENHVLLHIGVRLDPKKTDLSLLPSQMLAELHWPAPIFSRVDNWPEADPASCHDDGHQERMNAIRALLPAGIALIGSDYGMRPPSHKGIFRLNDRYWDGQGAARQIAGYLG